MSLARRPIRGIILDINGVLYESGESTPIVGSVEALERLKSRFNFCLATNHCTTPKRLLAQKLIDLGFGASISSDEQIVAPAPVACDYILRNKLVPHFYVAADILEDFAPLVDEAQTKHLRPNCLVVGNAKSETSRELLDKALGEMLATPAGAQKPQIVSLGASRYYRDAGQLRLGTGAYAAAFEFALSVKALNVGKPSASFFELALRKLNAQPQDCLMIGDDLVSDVAGAQALGIRAALVETGKFEPADATRNCHIKPDATFKNLAAAVDFLMQM